ncbi:hypothetical protein M011DRAFT_222651 [Sporormia fimetaria CBS 119925]|uniref:Homeobox domain-containing protein n=1 Tax=Sporormia fimetaria CBS 119925 TaxID=1340428 RepID=A0A6A6UYL6_9PLEO|nr:hypothetical protein M011DRAFT_222651 [Sporormia fimetaria CBS 119925]
MRPARQVPQPVYLPRPAVIYSTVPPPVQPSAHVPVSFSVQLLPHLPDPDPLPPSPYSAYHIQAYGYPEEARAMYQHGRNTPIRRRGSLPKLWTNTFKAWLIRNRDNPYPSDEQKQEWQRASGLSMTQISNWFINGRRRVLRRRNRDDLDLSD